MEKHLRKEGALRVGTSWLRSLPVRNKVGLAITVLALVALLWPSGRRGATPNSAVKSPSAAPNGTEPSADGTEEMPRTPGAFDWKPGEPIIDRIIVEKSEVCAGEENVVRVEAHASDGKNEYLSVSIDDPGSGRTFWGSRIPVRLQRPLTRPMRVVVHGRTGVAGADVPHITVKNCVAPAQVVIDVRRTLDALDRVTLKATLLEPADGARGGALVVESYDWEFGDGAKETSSGAEVEHSYEAREQNVAQASYVVNVTMKWRDGRQARGSRAVAFVNAGFGQWAREGSVLVSAGVQETAPATDSSPPSERIWLYHGYRQPVRIEKVRLRETVLDGDKERETLNREYEPSELLGFAELPPGVSLTTRDLSSFRPTVRNATAVRYVEVRGRTRDGKAATGTFTLVPNSRRSPPPKAIPQGER
jgi:hypothetical protein